MLAGVLAGTTLSQLPHGAGQPGYLVLDGTPEGGIAVPHGDTHSREQDPQDRPVAGGDPAGDPAAGRSGSGLLLALLCFAQAMVILDITVVNVALPAIRAGLHFSDVGMQWIVTAYTLCFGGLLLLGGRLGDLVDRRRVFLLAATAFGLASLVGGLAHTRAELLAARAVQGAAAAAIAPATLAFLTIAFAEGRARARALAVWSAFTAAGGALGVLLGGVLTDLLSWRAVFLVNVPLAAVVMAFAPRLLPAAPAGARRRRLDLLGSVLITGALVALTAGIVNVQPNDWSGSTGWLLGGGVVLLLAFVASQRRVADPLVPLEVFRNRSLSVGNVISAVFSVSLFASFFLLSVYMQRVLGYSPLRAGAALLPLAVFTTIGAFAASRLVTRYGPRPLLIVGPLLTAVGLLWFSRLSPGDSFVAGILGPSILTAVSSATTFLPITAAATSQVPPEQAGLASSLLNTSRQLGGSLGLAILVTVATSRTEHLLRAGSSAVDALSSGYTLAFVVTAGLTACVAAIALALPRQARTAPQPAAASASD